MNKLTPLSSLQGSPLDRFARPINYARLSVTDRCDFRCVYCMAEDMKFIPRREILSLEEILQLAKVLVDMGINRLRLTGGEPLVRNNLLWLVDQIGQLDGLQELSLTTNGARLAPKASALAARGLKRVNISLDTLQPDKFRQLTRTGDLNDVKAGIAAATAAGFEKVKLNSVIMKQRNDDEILDLLEFAIDNALDISFIEEMPLGHIDEHDRKLAFCSSAEVREIIASRYSLLPSDKKTNGPSRYCAIKRSDTHIGFISPHSQNFCADCNRIRVTAEGKLLLCLGNEDSLDLRQLMRDQQASDAELAQAIAASLQKKPERHNFDLDQPPEIVRFMNSTGG